MPMLFAMFGVSEVGAWNFPASQYRVDEFMFQCRFPLWIVRTFTDDRPGGRDYGRPYTTRFLPILPGSSNYSSKYATILRIPKKPSIITINVKLRRPPLLSRYHRQRIRFSTRTIRNGNSNRGRVKYKDSPRRRSYRGRSQLFRSDCWIYC